MIVTINQGVPSIFSGREVGGGGWPGTKEEGFVLVFHRQVEPLWVRASLSPCRLGYCKAGLFTTVQDLRRIMRRLLETGWCIALQLWWDAGRTREGGITKAGRPRLSPNVVLMLGQRRRRCPSIKTALGGFLLLDGKPMYMQARRQRV